MVVYERLQATLDEHQRWTTSRQHHQQHSLHHPRPPRTKLTTNSEDPRVSLMNILPLIVRLHGRISPPLQRRCNSVRENVAIGGVRRAEMRGRMSNERLIRLGQRCGNGLGTSTQGQSVGTDGQSKQPPLGAIAVSG